MNKTMLFGLSLLLALVASVEAMEGQQKGTTRRRSASTKKTAGADAAAPGATTVAANGTPARQRRCPLRNIAAWSMKRKVLLFAAILVASDYASSVALATEALTPQILAMITSWYPTQEAALLYLRENCPADVMEFALNNMSVQMIKCYAHHLVIGIGTLWAGACGGITWVKDGIVGAYNGAYGYMFGEHQLTCVVDSLTNQTVCS